jgi:hypothetical protein
VAEFEPLVPEEQPTREAVNLGGRTVELDPEAAAAVRGAFQGLADTYAQSLEQERRRVLDQLGTPGWQMPESPALEVPDPDLLFQNKDVWKRGLEASVDAKLQALQAQQQQLVQGAVSAVDQELQRRDAAARARTEHDAAMESMLEAKGLTSPAHRRLVQAIYTESFDRVKHLPIEVAFDQIGTAAIEDISALGGGKAAPASSEPERKAPAMLRSARRAGTAPAPQEPAPKTISDLIRGHQRAVLHGSAA